MRLIHAPDGTVDRYERSLWLTMPFDMAISLVAIVASPFRLAAAQLFVASSVDGQVFTAGAGAGQAYVAGAVEGQADAQ